jgi:hypothetical protein
MAVSTRAGPYSGPFLKGEQAMEMSSAELSRLVEEAGFIFRGKVTGGQTPATQDSTAQQTVTAQIEEILLSTEVLRGLVGRSVTVISQQGAPREDEGSFFFFTNCIVLANQIVVREVGRIRASRDADRGVAEALKDAAERPLRERAASAELIIEGHVTASAPADPNAVQKSEHDPNWWIARVAVDSLVKGGGKAVKSVEVLFANSEDIAWHKSPKLHEGLRGIFLLHSVKETDRPPKVNRLMYQATDPLDFLPAERLPEVERALRSEKGNHEKGGR